VLTAGIVLNKLAQLLFLIMKPRRMRRIVHVARMGEQRNAYRVLMGKPEGKRGLGRPRRRWEDNTVKPVLNGITFFC
jgi:hypothetical protein